MRSSSGRRWPATGWCASSACGTRRRRRRRSAQRLRSRRESSSVNLGSLGRQNPRVMLALVQVEDAGLDLLVDVVHGELAGHADGVLDGLGVGAAVADDAAALDAKERGAAVFGVIHPLLQVVECSLRQERTELARKRAG